MNRTMGKTKTIIIDDSKPKAEVKSKKLKVKNEEKSLKRKEEDSLVAKLREELGIEEEEKETAKSSATKASGALRIDEPATKTKKPGKAKPRSKKYLEATKDLDRSKIYPLPEALDMVKKMFYAKFNDSPGALEVHINTVQTGLRGFASLPYASGRKRELLVFAKAGEDFSGAITGNESTISEIEQGKIPYDVIIATPDWMPKLAKIAKVLGPRGLLPNPKNGTITDNPKKAVESFQSGKVEFKTETKAPVIHLSLGKLDQPNEELEANVKTLLLSIGKSKIKKITLAPTMGPGVKLDLTSV